MNDNEKQEKSFAVILRKDASNEVEKAIYSIRGLSRAISYITRGNDELDEDGLNILMELALSIEEGADKIIGLTVAGDQVELVEIEGDRIRLAE